MSENTKEFESKFIEKADLFSKNLNGEELSETVSARALALDHFRVNGFPTKKSEEYKFTNFSGVVEKNFQSAAVSPESELTASEVNDAFNFPDNAIKVIIVNGRYREDLSDSAESVSGLGIYDFKGYTVKFPGQLKGILGKHADTSKDSFTAWNTIYANDGLVITVDDKAVIEKPIFILYISDTRGGNKVVSFPRLVFTAGRQSEVEFNSFYRTIGERDSLINEVREVILGDDTHVKMNRVQDDVEGSYSISHTKVNQPSNSTFTSGVVTVSGAMIRNNLSFDVDGQGAEANMYGLYLTKGSTHVDNHTTVDHIQPNSCSNELYKGIMDGKSRGVFNGKIYVQPEAQKTNAFQSNNNILLSDQAVINTKPQLEIWADDVKCSHGCTTGQMDEEAIFYLRSRGINESDARALILKAFASDIVEKIDNEWLREYLETIIIDRLTSFN